MVNLGMLAAELVYANLQVDVRVRIEFRHHFGRPVSEEQEDEHGLLLLRAKVDAVEAFADVLRYEYSKVLAEKDVIVSEEVSDLVDSDGTTSVWHKHINDQLDLFPEYIATYGVLPSSDSSDLQ